MSMTFGAVAKCSVHMANHSQQCYPGDPIEGTIVINATKPFRVKNIHVKVVGKEQVHAMVDQVKQARVNTVQFGVSSQDYIYYREIVTLVGDLLTQKRKAVTPSAGQQPLAVPPPDVEGGDAPGPSTAGTAAPGDDNGQEAPYEESGSDVDAPEDEARSGFNEPRSVEEEQLQRSFVVSNLSMTAATEGGYVVFPEGTYVYPFRFLLPMELPPSYRTGVRVKDEQFSNSKASLVYYVKVYVSSSHRLLDTAKAEFRVLPVQPAYNNRTFLGCRGLHLSSDAKVVECRFPIDSACSCFGGGDGSLLRVRFALEDNYYEAGKDHIHICCGLKNTSSKPIRGLVVSLVEVVTFRTVEAEVTTRNVVLTQSFDTVVAPEQSTSIDAVTAKIEDHEDILPTMCTSGVRVRYHIRVELKARHIADPFYEFEGVVVAGPKDAFSVPPCGEMVFTALPRGVLSSREAYYVVPSNPCESAQLPILNMTSGGGAGLGTSRSGQTSRVTSRWASRAPSRSNSRKNADADM